MRRTAVGLWGALGPSGRALRRIRKTRPAYTRFVVLATQRTGSTLLVSLLDSHPQVLCRGELFHPKNVATLRARGVGSGASYLSRGIFGEAEEWVRAAGFRVMYGQAARPPWSDAWRLLRRDRGLKVIDLRRRNLLRSLVSAEIAKKTGEWSALSFRDPADLATVRLTPAQCTRYFEHVTRLRRRYLRLFRGHEILATCYEDLVDDPDRTMRAILDFLGVEPAAVRSELARQDPRPLCEALRNYDELERFFWGARREGFFAETL